MMKPSPWVFKRTFRYTQLMKFIIGGTQGLGFLFRICHYNILMAFWEFYKIAILKITSWASLVARKSVLSEIRLDN